MTANLKPRPVLGSPVRWQFPTTHEHRLSNGLRVLTFHLPGKQLASVAVLLDLPVDSDPEGQEGLAAIAARCLDQGTEGSDAQAFADALERQGASWRAAAGYDGITATVDVPVSRLPDALGLLAAAVIRPAFLPAEVERVIRQRLAEIVLERSIPPLRATLEFASLLHHPGSRLALPAAGATSTVSTLTAEAVAQAYRTRAAARTSTLVVAGDLAGLDVLKLVEQAFGCWDSSCSEEAAPGRWSPTSPVFGQRRQAVVVNRPGAVQTYVVLGHDAVDRRSSAWSPMNLVSYSLGGTLTSRLDAVLREERGYTYGVRASFEAERRSGAFTIGGAVDTENTFPALSDLLDVLETAHDEGLREDERAVAREFLVGSSPMRWETPSAVAAQALAVVGNDLSSDWVDCYLEGLRTTSLEEMNATMRSHVRPRELLAVAVGDASSIAGQIEDLGLGAPWIVDA